MSKKGSSKIGAKQHTLWSQESMLAVVKAVDEGIGLREASRTYNVPLITLQRRVGSVDLEYRPGKISGCKMVVNQCYMQLLPR